LEVLAGKAPRFVIHVDETLRFQNRVYVPTIEELKTKILDEGQNTKELKTNLLEQYETRSGRLCSEMSYVSAS